ncbi:MAG TPA: hypothetical protein VG734_02110 [Lacunisphaera sp.]|nr:hypothetical protein [Lacunisphaera sp.]
MLRERADDGIEFEGIGSKVDEIPDGTGSRVGEPVEERVVEPEVGKNRNLLETLSDSRSRGWVLSSCDGLEQIRAMCGLGGGEAFREELKSLVRRQVCRCGEGDCRAIVSIADEEDKPQHVGKVRVSLKPRDVRAEVHALASTPAWPLSSQVGK